MISCPVCDIEIQSENYIKTYVSSFDATQYKLYHCYGCHIEFWYPLSVRPEFYEDEHCAAYEEFHSGFRQLPEWCAPFFEKFPFKKGKLLDIGCGDGIFLKSAENSGFEAWGIDFDKKSIETARNKLGLNNVYPMSLEEFMTFAAEKNVVFDVITFFEVLEHQDRPEEFIRSIKKILNNGGYIAGSVPNRERLFVNLDRELFSADFPPHHFLWFSKDVLKNLFLRNGFNRIELYPANLNLLKLSGWVESILLGRFSKKIKKSLKSSFLSPYVKNGKDLNKRIETFEELYGKSRRTYFLKFLRMIRNIIFVPLALFIYLEFNRRGPQIYFQAIYKSANKS